VRVLVWCERSGVVREAFRKRGHQAYSCDIEPSLDNSPYHIQDDILNQLDNQWDLLIAHPPCTDLAVSGSGSFWYKKYKQEDSVNFVRELMNAPIEKIAIENPIGILSTKIRQPDQIIHPWQFGHPERKSTCLWLKNLLLLKPTRIVHKREPVMHKLRPGKERSLLRSITYQGIANAMAEQWDTEAMKKSAYFAITGKNA
jgi:hypothetical protein